jgi:hypothetical protein
MGRRFFFTAPAHKASWVYVRQNGKTTNSIAGEVAGDFMFGQPTGIVSLVPSTCLQLQLCSGSSTIYWDECCLLIAIH